jgi:hypothetical protein
MLKQLLVKVPEDVHRQFRLLAIDRGVSNAKLVEQLLASATASSIGSQVPRQHAGGPQECEHGYARGLSCPRCDELLERLLDGKAPLSTEAP